MSEAKPPVARSGYVIVTIAGRWVHAYGPTTGGTYETRQRAGTDAKKMAARDRELHPNEEPARYVICKVLGEGLSI